MTFIYGSDIKYYTAKDEESLSKNECPNCSSSNLRHDSYSDSGVTIICITCFSCKIIYIKDVIIGTEVDVEAVGRPFTLRDDKFKLKEMITEWHDVVIIGGGSGAGMSLPLTSSYGTLTPEIEKDRAINENNWVKFQGWK